MRIPALLASVALLVAGWSPSAMAKPPTVGEPAPEFRFEGLMGGVATTYRSQDYVGESARKKGVVVAWFPKAFTPG